VQGLPFFFGFFCFLFFIGLDVNVDFSLFKKNYQQFQLGFLPTEMSHPFTVGLSEFAKHDLARAFDCFKKVDRLAFEKLSSLTRQMETLQQQAHMVWKNGGRVFMSGCGATGRLAIVLESLKRREGNSQEIISFMAGGDLALIRSLERFEDREDYGHRQLIELGFSSKDMLIAVTEGGETPFVLGTALKATEISHYPTYLLFCNPKELLQTKLDRCKRSIEHPNIRSIEILTGPMALSGSTRLQATSVQMSFLAIALLDWGNISIDKRLEQVMSVLDYDYRNMKHLTEQEGLAYLDHQEITYQAPLELAPSVLTDTTERSPTFSLSAFENHFTPTDPPSWSYLNIPSEKDALSAWEHMLSRKVRCLEWSELNGVASIERLKGYDLSDHGFKIRNRRKHQMIFEVQTDDLEMVLSFNRQHLSIDTRGMHPFVKNLYLKLLLNAHSTLVMGINDRYQSNVMTWVRPSNFKLVDRSTRYALQLLAEQNRHGYDYLTVAERVCFEANNERATGPVVLRVVNYFLSS
jgi:N-acetylmuramic acid 6-phosphate etherase